MGGGSGKQLEKLCNHSGSLKRDAGGVRVKGEGNIMMEAKIIVMHFEDGRRGHKPRNINGH